MDIFEFIKLVRLYIVDLGDEEKTTKRREKILKAIDDYDKAGYLD